MVFVLTILRTTDLKELCLEIKRVVTSVSRNLYLNQTTNYFYSEHVHHRRVWYQIRNDSSTWCGVVWCGVAMSVLVLPFTG